MSRMNMIVGAVLLLVTLLTLLRALAWRVIRRFEYLKPGFAGAPGKFINVDGVQLHYVEMGSGPTVLLIHGWNGSTFDYRYTIAALAERFHIVAVDMMGYGYSGRPLSGDYSLRGQAELLARFSASLRIAQMTVVGHSMGGGVALELAASHPELVQQLVLVASVTPREVGRTRFPRLFVWLLPFFALVGLTQAFMERALAMVVHDQALLTPEMREGHLRPLRVEGHFRAQQQQMRARLGEVPLDPHRVVQPALLLWGEHDRVVPIRHGEELASILPTAELVVVPSAGHLPLEEQPAFCNREILRFIRQASSDDGSTSIPSEPAEASP